MSYWNMDNPAKPWGLFDPDASLDFPVDFSEWLADMGVAYGSHTIIPDPNLQVVQSAFVSGVITARISKASSGTLAAGTKYPVTYRIFTNETPPQHDDRTVWLKIADR